jgi:hypothetical protein
MDADAEQQLLVFGYVRVFKRKRRWISMAISTQATTLPNSANMASPA